MILKIHRITGMFIFLFVILHLLNHAASFIHVDQHIEMMRILRVVYRHPVVETSLLVAILGQIYTGLYQFKHTQSAVHPTFVKLQRYSGLYLSFFFFIHISAILWGRYLLKLDTNFYFGVAGLNTFPLNLFFIPYYFLAIIAFFGHISAIHALKMKSTIFGISPQKQALMLLISGLIIASFILLSLTNMGLGFEIPAEYKLLNNK